MSINHKAIQFIGTQRSGSNLLRLMLNQLPEISAPHPPHILKTFIPLLDHYGDLSDKDNFKLLAADVCEWVNVNPVPWEGVTFTPDEIIKVCRIPTLLELFVKMYEAKAEHDHARFWCCKSMESVHYIDQIEKAGIQPYYIYIYRDGRDVALSFLKSIVGPKHVYYLAKKWMEEQQLSLETIKKIGPERIITIKYEELIHEPRPVMKGICNTLGVEYTEEIFEYYHSEESINTAISGQMWKNVVKPIMADNHDKFRKELDDEQLMIFERVAGKVLAQLGYKTYFLPDLLQQDFSAEELQRFKGEAETQYNKVIGNALPEELERRKPQEALLTRIKARPKRN